MQKLCENFTKANFSVLDAKTKEFFQKTAEYCAGYDIGNICRAGMVLTWMGDTPQYTALPGAYDIDEGTYRLDISGEETQVFAELSKNSRQVLDSLAKHMDILNYEKMSKEELVRELENLSIVSRWSDFDYEEEEYQSLDGNPKLYYGTVNKRMGKKEILNRLVLGLHRYKISQINNQNEKSLEYTVSKWLKKLKLSSPSPEEVIEAYRKKYYLGPMLPSMTSSSLEEYLKTRNPIFPNDKPDIYWYGEIPRGLSKKEVINRLVLGIKKFKDSEAPDEDIDDLADVIGDWLDNDERSDNFFAYHFPGEGGDAVIEAYKEKYEKGKKPRTSRYTLLPGAELAHEIFGEPTFVIKLSDGGLARDLYLDLSKNSKPVLQSLAKMFKIPNYITLTKPELLEKLESLSRIREISE